MSKLGYASFAARALTCALATSLLLAAGCGGSQKPNPLPPEEPMDKSGSSASDSPTTTAASSDSSSSDPSAVASATDSSGAGAGAATPTPAPAPDASDSDPKGKKGKGKKGKGAKGELSAAECQALSGKGIELLGASMGMTDPSMMAQLKQQAAGDPNFSNMQTECVKSTTRAQYKCGMAAKSKDAWEACLK